MAVKAGLGGPLLSQRERLNRRVSQSPEESPPAKLNVKYQHRLLSPHCHSLRPQENPVHSNGITNVRAFIQQVNVQTSTSVLHLSPVERKVWSKGQTVAWEFRSTLHCGVVIRWSRALPLLARLTPSDACGINPPWVLQYSTATRYTMLHRSDTGQTILRPESTGVGRRRNRFIHRPLKQVRPEVAECNVIAITKIH